jgi:hypothetical protein
MIWIGSGFVPILIYSTNSGEIVVQDRAILTENSFDILTESSIELVTET